MINIVADRINQMNDIQLQQDIMAQAQSEILLNLTEEEMSDDEGRSQSQASSSSASTDVFNSTTSYAWSTARYRNRGLISCDTLYTRTPRRNLPYTRALRNISARIIYRDFQISPRKIKP